MLKSRMVAKENDMKHQLWKMGTLILVLATAKLAAQYDKSLIPMAFNGRSQTNLNTDGVRMSISRGIVIGRETNAASMTNWVGRGAPGQGNGVESGAGGVGPAPSVGQAPSIGTAPSLGSAPSVATAPSAGTAPRP
jgi:hypothetical protein